MQRVKVPRAVAEQLERIRQSGEVNMFDRRGVQVIAHRRQFFELVVWLEDHKHEYGTLVLHGPEIEEGSGKGDEPTPGESEAFWTERDRRRRKKIYRIEDERKKRRGSPDRTRDRGSRH